MTEAEPQAELRTIKAVRELRQFYRNVRHQEDLLDWLIDNAWDDELATNCTWLIKHHLSKQGAADTRQSDEILELLSCLRPWHCQLQLLQSLPHLQISRSMKTPLRLQIDELLKSENKMVRAWTYNAFHLLALQYPEYRSEVEDLLLKSLETEAPSAVARIRALLRQRGIPVRERRMT